MERKAQEKDTAEESENKLVTFSVRKIQNDKSWNNSFFSKGPASNALK